MADLSDADLAAIVRANEHPDCCRFIPVRSLRAAIAADRELNAAPSVGAEGLPGFAAWWRDNFEAGTPQDASFAEAERCARVVWMAALASRPAVDADKRTLLEQYDLDQSPEYRKGYEDGRLNGYEVGHRHAREAAARHPAQREGE